MNADHEHWSRITTEWVAWAQTPNHDAFLAYRASLLAFIGRGEGEALDVGCGGGRVSRVPLCPDGKQLGSGILVEVGGVSRILTGRTRHFRMTG